MNDQPGAGITDGKGFAIIIPVKNESAGLALVLPEIRKLYRHCELIVVDDGSSESIDELCRVNSVTRLLKHPYSMGNGAAVKTGARNAQADILVFMDGDAQHEPADIRKLLEPIEEGFDMVVGARSNGSHASVWRFLANTFYNRFATFIVGQKIHDLTSGFRAVRKKYFNQFLYLLPNGFSYPTTSTMAFFRSGYAVKYVPIEAAKRIGQSHIRIFRDGSRFLMILFKIGTLFSPLKIFLPVSALLFGTGTCYYLYTYITVGRFTNMSALLFTTAVTIFLMGLVSEQITSLIYRQNSDN